MMIVVLASSSFILSSPGVLIVLPGGDSDVRDWNGVGKFKNRGESKDMTTISSTSKNASPWMDISKLLDGAKLFGG